MVLTRVEICQYMLIDLDENPHQINMPSSSDKIYKEECICCCDTPYAVDGLFICLQSFKSFSKAILEQYVRESNNPAFLNIRKVRLIKDQSDEPEPKKLAIGAEDGFRPDEMPWREKTEVKGTNKKS